MHINFKHLKIHGFLSLGDVDLDLNNKNYCLIKGINNNPNDDASSNGSGKSSIFNALCWAFCGETINGLKSNIVNINLDDGCFVEVDFEVNQNNYKIIRYKDYKKIGTNLKIYINGEDKSGVTLRKSEELLNQYLPNLNETLIGSVIILGQGLPHKFSENTPSGRKEILETLSQSDIMIYDIKDRVDRRLNELNSLIRENEDNILKNNSQLSIFKEQLTQYQNNLANLPSCESLDNNIISIKKNIDQINTTINENKQNLINKNSELEKVNNDLFSLLQTKNKEIDELNKKYNENKNSNILEKNKLELNINNLVAEVKKLKSIVDICPTCGQKIPGVVKQDTSNQEKEIKELQLKLELNKNSLITLEQLYRDNLKEINSKYVNEEQRLNSLKTNLNTTISNINKALDSAQQSLLSYNNKLTQLQKDKENYLNNVNNINNQIENISNKIKELEDNLIKLDEQKTKYDNHISIINKINSLIKRDFRGYLLTGIIDYINKKVKEYCIDVFGNNNLDFVLDGNNINITFCNKAYENLSGGEKQKIDLIIQLSIRDFLCYYLDFSSNILVLDEITDNLDGLGCDKILNLISNRLSDVESIFIISHRANELNIPADNEIIIEKDEKGVSKIR